MPPVIPALSVDDLEQQGHKPCGICDLPHGAASCILYIQNSCILGLELGIETAQASVLYKEGRSVGMCIYCDIF